MVYILVWIVIEMDLIWDGLVVGLSMLICLFLSYFYIGVVFMLWERILIRGLFIIFVDIIIIIIFCIIISVRRFELVVVLFYFYFF